MEGLLGREIPAGDIGVGDIENNGFGDPVEDVGG